MRRHAQRLVLGGIASGATALGSVPAAVAYSIEEKWLAGVAVVGVYLTTLVATYFAVALAAASAEVLDGRNATVRGATAAPRRTWGRSPAGRSCSPRSTS